MERAALNPLRQVSTRREEEIQRNSGEYLHFSPESAKIGSNKMKELVFDVEAGFG